MARRAWLLAALAIAVRAAATLTVAVIDSDGARDLRMADLIERGRFTDALLVRHPTPPLHALLTATLDTALGNLQVAGVAVSVLLGGLALLPLYALASRVGDARVATVASALYAFLPAVVDLQIEPMTEGTFMFFFLASMASGWSALEDRSWERTIVAAGCAALAWLTRPEGIYLLPLFLAAALLRFSRFAPLGIALFLGTWLVLAFPYLSFIHAQTGRWQMSLSSIPGSIVGVLTGERPIGLPGGDYDEYRAVAKYGIVLGATIHLGGAFFGKVLFYGLGPFLLLGLFGPRPAGEGRRAPLAWILLAAFGYLVPIALSFAASTPFSHRFLLVPATLLLPVISVGVIRAAEWTRRPQALPVLAGVLCLVMAVRDFRPRRTDKLALKEAGLAIREALGPGRRIFATNSPIEYYARSEYAPLPEGATLQDLESARLDAFAFGDVNERRWPPHLQDEIRSKYALLGEFPSSPRKGDTVVRVYVAK